MNLHEYQAKEILRKYGLPVPPGAVAAAPEEAAGAAGTLGGSAWVVKAQVHAGGRGKAGGIKMAGSPDDVADAAKALLGTRLVTAQTGAEGKAVGRVYVEQAVDVAREIYLAALVDRALGRVALLASAEGGEDIEEKAKSAPEKIIKLVVDPGTGLEAAQAQKLAQDLGLSGKQADDAANAMAAIYQAFTDNDASLIEVNPLGITAGGELAALDVKMIVDDNAVFRHPELQKLWDEAEVDPGEVEARRFELNYVRMEGDIGVMVTGAGLALGILDMIVERGGRPADFMDARPVASRDQIAAGVGMLLANPKVKVILVGAIGGGVLRCDTVAEGIALACKKVGDHVPVVFRAAGTAKELGELALRNQGVRVIFADDLEDAADKAIAAAKEGG